jgi:hypothetical protein
MIPHHTPRVQVLVAGQAVEAAAIRHEPEAFQVLLEEARRRFGHALCSCQRPPLKLVIRDRQGKLFLAAWPNQAQSHALDCPFYTEERTGANEYAPGAISQDGDRTNLALAHPLRQTDRHQDRGEGEKESIPAKDRSAPRERLHLWGLLHYLWEQAGLNRWYPGWHRDWGFVRHVLRRVAQNTTVEGHALLPNLYVPPVWIPAKQDQINAHWDEFVRPLRLQHRRSPTVAAGIVIGMARALEPTEFGYSLRLHHHAERFYMDHALADILARHSRRGWAAIKHLNAAVDADEKPYVVAAMRVQATHTGRLTIVEAALMRVSPRFIPVNSSYEDKVARLLVAQDRQFVRPLHYDSHFLELPDFILKDVAPPALATDSRLQSVALFVYGETITPAQKQRLAARDRRNASAEGLGFWEWDAATDAAPPALPQAGHRPIRQAIDSTPNATV